MESASTSGGLLRSISPATGYISPQFHCTYDDYFKTPKLEGRIDVHWKRLAKLQEDEETEYYDDKEFNMIQGQPLKDYEPRPPLFPLTKMRIAIVMKKCDNDPLGWLGSWSR